MKQIIIPTDQHYKLPFYLATEEWVARNLPEGEYFFCWVVNPTVIIGRNQIIDLEVDLEYCRKMNIEVYRRRSGGGCVYADPGNIMMSYITSRTNIQSTFAHYANLVANMLQQLGIKAEVSGRNDVMVEGRKISGNAFYRLPQRSIVHGTMLHSADPTRMLHAITPSRSKLLSKQVQSVASHITTVSEYHEITFVDFQHHIINTLCDQKPVTLSTVDIQQIHKIESDYYLNDWIFGRKYCNRNELHRIENVGEFNVYLKLNQLNRIADIDLSGDFFIENDIDEYLLSKLIGAEFSVAGISEALKSVDVGKVIIGLKNEQLINLLINSQQPKYQYT